jgi:hypothetical protein
VNLSRRRSTSLSGSRLESRFAVQGSIPVAMFYLLRTG